MVHTGHLSFYKENVKPFLFGNNPFLKHVSDCDFYVRPRTYDLYVLAETFLERVYKPSFVFKNPKVPTIVDLGGYIGDFSIWALKTFNPEKVIVLEIDPSNVAQLKKNLELNDKNHTVILEEKELYYGSPQIVLKRNILNTGGHHVDSGSKGLVVPTITLEQLLSKHAIDYIDYLKVDVEGSERFLISNTLRDTFVSKVDIIVMEVHPRYGVSVKEVESFFSKIGFKTRVYKYPFNSAYMFEAKNANS